jgi:hypothetical protein
VLPQRATLTGERGEVPFRAPVSTAVRYEIVTVNHAGSERRHQYVTGDELTPGDVVQLEGRYWLIEQMEAPSAGTSARAFAKPARYRLLLRHPAGSVEAGAFRRYRPDAPGLGHAFTTLEDGQPVSWEVVDRQLARDADGEPYVELVAERDYRELEELPDHELEHALNAGQSGLSPAAEAMFARAEEAGNAVELVALDPGEAPDWTEAEEYLDALVLEEVEDDLLVLSGVDPNSDPRDSWLETVKERLRADLELFRQDIEGDHDEIEEWDFRGGRIFASVGSFEDEADPERGHGWMVRLFDGGVLTAAGFERIRKPQLNSDGA